MKCMTAALGLGNTCLSFEICRTGRLIRERLRQRSNPPDRTCSSYELERSHRSFVLMTVGKPWCSGEENHAILSYRPDFAARFYLISHISMPLFISIDRRQTISDRIKPRSPLVSINGKLMVEVF